MKKVLAIFLTTLMSFGLIACVPRTDPSPELSKTGSETSELSETTAATTTESSQTSVSLESSESRISETDSTSESVDSFNPSSIRWKAHKLASLTVELPDWRYLEGQPDEYGFYHYFYAAETNDASEGYNYIQQVPNQLNLSDPLSEANVPQEQLDDYMDGIISNMHVSNIQNTEILGMKAKTYKAELYLETGIVYSYGLSIITPEQLLTFLIADEDPDSEQIEYIFTELIRRIENSNSDIDYFSGADTISSQPGEDEAEDWYQFYVGDFFFDLPDWYYVINEETEEKGIYYFYATGAEQPGDGYLFLQYTTISQETDFHLPADEANEILESYTVGMRNSMDVASIEPVEIAGLVGNRFDVLMAGDGTTLSGQGVNVVTNNYVITVIIMDDELGSEHTMSIMERIVESMLASNEPFHYAASKGSYS